MPKLSSETGQKATEAAADSPSGSREPLPAGRYRVRLLDVESTKSSKSDPMWKWKFEVADGAAPDCQGRWLWENTVLTDRALWKIGSIFAAFGVPADTDTDDLVGELCDVEVVQEVAERGKLKGQLVNSISSFIAAAPTGGAPAKSAAAQPAQEVPF